MPSIEIEIPDRLWSQMELEAKREGISIDALMEKVLHLSYRPLSMQTGGGKTRITGTINATVKDQET